MRKPAPSERVLSTLNADGTRFWIDPKLSRGRFLHRRRIVGYTLIALFVILPFVRINGRPAFLLDLVARELSVFGAVFRPSDGFLLMLLGLTIVLLVFYITALFGRVWCGWGCPQTVYMEFIFRPIERRLKKHPVVKWAVFIAICFVLANVFLSYFVGTARLARWVIGSPADNLGGFFLVLGVAALMVFDFGYFREQTCIVACPYGRLQAVLIDNQSLIVGYDAKRGEPRAQHKKNLPVIEGRGDCVDCNACVATCPTGIDIRNGLQMECIGCAQCIDACDTVMDKLKLPRNLIGHTSRDMLDGKGKRVLRARTLIYPAMLVLVAGLFVWGVTTRGTTKVWIDRIEGATFVELPDGTISSQLRLKIENESTQPARYTASLPGAVHATLRGQLVVDVRARRSFEISLFVDSPRTAFVRGRRTVTLELRDEHGEATTLEATLFGPEGAAR